jgi:hypothetical protein
MRRSRRTKLSESLPGETRAVFPKKPKAPRTPKTAAIPKSDARRTGGGKGITLATSAVPVASAPATAKQALGGGTREEPTTASARSRRLRKGKADPNPQAKWRTASAARIPPVSRAEIRMSLRVVGPRVCWGRHRSRWPQHGTWRAPRCGPSNRHHGGRSPLRHAVGPPRSP